MNFGIFTYIAVTGILAVFLLALLIITAIIIKYNLKIWVRYQVFLNRIHPYLGWSTIIMVIVHVSLALSTFEFYNLDYWAGLIAFIFFLFAFITGIIKYYNIEPFKKYQLPSSKIHYILGFISLLFVFIHMFLGVLIFHYSFFIAVVRILHV